LEYQISLAAARTNAELSQEQAAQEIGIATKTIGNYEKGKTPIPWITLKKLAHLYQVPEDMIRIPIVDDGKFDEDEKNLDYTTF